MAVNTTTSSAISRVPFFYGWVVLGVAGLAIFCSGPGQTYSVSVFVDPIIEDLGWSRTMVSGLYTAGSLTAAMAMIFVGRLLDRYGARIMLGIVVVLFSVVVAAMSLINHPVHLYLGFAGIRTLGQGSLTLIPTTLVAIWFVRLRGRATALTTLGMGASTASFPPLIHWLISNSDWREAWIVLSIIVCALLLLPALLLVRRSPESVGLLPDGVARPESAWTGAAGTSRPAEVSWQLGEAVRTRAFWLLLGAMSSPSIISTALMFHHISLMESRGIGTGMAAVVLSVIAPSVLVGSLAAGFLSDILPNRFIMAASQAFLAVSLTLALTVSHTWQAFLYGAVLGTGGGASMTTSAVIWANYYGRGHLGAIRGASQVGMVAFAAMGPLPFSLLLDVAGSYNSTFFALLAFPVLSALFALLAVPPVKREASS